MSSPDAPSGRSFIQQVEALLGRRLDADEARLATSLEPEKSAEVVARELQATVIADPKKIRPEHSDTADE